MRRPRVQKEYIQMKQITVFSGNYRAVGSDGACAEYRARAEQETAMWRDAR